jgi:simple sugar transport system permease protein
MSPETLAFLANLLTAAILLATPLLLAALGELVVEKSGVLNLGVEGMMLIGALFGYIAAYNLQTITCLEELIPGFCNKEVRVFTFTDYLLSLVAAAAAGALLAAIFGGLTQGLRANHVAVGLGLSILGAGLSNSLGSNFFGVNYTSVQVADHPSVFGQDLLVWLSLLAVPAIWYALQKTRTGLVIRAVGENHDSAFALGYRVSRIRFYCILFGGAMAGLAGAFIVLVHVDWKEGVTVGKGWLALALILFGTWRPLRVLAGAYIFGLLWASELRLDNLFPAWQLEWKTLLTAAPYLFTIIVLVLISRNPRMIRQNAPASLGKPFNPPS